MACHGISFTQAVNFLLEFRRKELRSQGVKGVILKGLIRFVKKGQGKRTAGKRETKKKGCCNR